MGETAGAAIRRDFGRRPAIRPRMPDVRGPLVAIVVAAMVTSIATVVPTLLPTGDDAEVAGPVAAATAASQVVQPGMVPDGLSLDEWTSIQQQIAAAEAFRAVPSVVDRTPSPAGPTVDLFVGAPRLDSAGLVARFAVGSAALTSSTLGEDVVLATSRLGDVEAFAAAAAPTAAGIEFEHATGVTEWFRSTPAGLQQGFTIDAPVSDSGTFDIVVGVDGGRPSLVDPQTVSIVRPGQSALTYRDLIAWDANDVPLPAAMSVDGTDIVLTVDATDATYPITVDPIITEDAKLLPTPDAAGDRFGESVAIDGTPGDMTIVVGARLDDDQGRDRGVAYVFHDDGSGWDQQATLYPDTPGDIQFGWDVDVHVDAGGNEIVAVGAPGDDSNGTNAGAVYVFEPTGGGGAWQQTSKIYQCDPGVTSPCGASAGVGAGFAGDAFGFAVDATEDFIVVGAPFDGTGAAFLYTASGADWVTTSAQTLTAPGLAADDQFGFDVSAADEGTHVVVGSPNFGASDQGTGWYYQWNGASLTAALQLTVGNVADGNAGAAVAVGTDVDGDVFQFVGQPVNTRFEDGTQPGDSHVWLTVLPNGLAPIPANLVYKGSTVGSAGKGNAIDFTGGHVIFGHYLDGSLAPGNGRFTYFPINTVTNGYQSGIFGFIDSSAETNWAFDVAAEGDVYVVAGPGDDTAGTDAGQIRVRRFSGGGVDIAINPQVANHDDRFGFAVDISGDRMAVSAIGDDRADPDAGAVFMYVRNDEFSPWVPDGVIVDPSPMDEGRFGDAVALSGDQVAIGDSDRFGDQADPGLVHVFVRTAPGTWTQRGASIGTGFGGYDSFGTSVAWQDVDTLIVGAPDYATTGAVFQVTWNSGPGEWNLPASLASVEAPAVGDGLGYSVDVSEELTGDHVIVAGAPGDDLAGNNAGALHIFRDPAGASPPAGLQVVQAGTGWGAEDRMGTAVAAHRSFLAVAGLGTEVPGSDFQAYLLEPFLSNFLTVGTFTSTLTVAIDGSADARRGPNDYLDLVGRNLFLSRPGGGGQVGIFSDIDGAGFPSSPVDQFIPSVRELGDAIGYSVSVDGGSLAAGASGDDDNAGPQPLLVGDSGAVYTASSLSLSHTFIAGVGDWEDPANWDTGIVPGSNETAIVPAGAVVDVNDPLIEIGSLVIVPGGQVNVVSGGRLILYSAEIGGVVQIQSGGTLDVPTDINFAGGTVDNLAGGTVNLFPSDASLTISGNGSWSNAGTVNKFGGFPAFVENGVGWSSATTSQIVVQFGELAMGVTTYPENGGISVKAGARIRFADNFWPQSTSIINIEIDGPSASPGTYGVLEGLGNPVLGDATLSSTLVGGYVPTGADSYLVIECVGCDPFGTTNVAPFEATLGGSGITLALPAGPAGPLTVDTLVDTIAADGDCSLREAIIAANADSSGGDCGTASGADYIDFAVSGTIALGSRLPTITDEVYIDGGGQTVVIDGQTTTGNDGTAILLVDSAGTATLSKLTVARGRSATCAVGTDTCGAVQNYGNLTVDDSTFSANQGGGLTNGIAITNRGGGDVTINRSTFADNRGGPSGAIFNADAGTTLAINNSTFSGNTAAGVGAIYNAFGATTTITNSTVVDTGGSATLRNAGGSPAVTLRNTIVTASTGGPACQADDPFSADSFNFDTDGTCGGATTATVGELALGPLADNGGPTQTVALQPGSVATDAAFYPYCSETEVANQDQRGEFRPQGLGCDIGAFEAPGTPPANKVTSGNTGRDRFGIDVDVDGDTAVVAEVDLPGETSSVWVLTRDGGTGSWSITQRLSPGSISSGVVDVAIADGVIAAVAENGNVQIWEDSGAPLNPFVTAPTTPGLAQMRTVDTDGTGVFAAGPLGGTLWTKAGGTWQPSNSGDAVSPFFGAAVSIDSGAIVVAENDPVGVSDGVVNVYDRVGAVWSGAAGQDGPIDVLTAPAGSTTDGYFGSAVAIQGSTLVIGQDLEDNDPGDPRGVQADAGAVWVYSGGPGAWSAPAKLVPADNDTANRFGWSVAIDGASIVVGASGAEELGVPTRNGAAYLYRQTPGGLWIEADTLRAADSQASSQFGNGVGVSGTRVIVGAPLDDNENGVDAGAAYVFDVVLPDNPELTFDLSLDSSPVVNVAPGGLAVAEFSGAALERNATSSATVAASPLSAIDVQDAPLSAIQIGSTPLSAIVLNSTPLSAIPLSAIDIDGGWDDLIAGTTLANVPFSTLTFDDALLDPSVNAAIQAAPLSAIDVNGTPLSAIPLSAIALGSTPLSAIPLSAIGSSWCDIVTAHVQGVSCPAGTDDVDISLLEATLRGVPLSAIPLSAIPLSAIDFTDPTVQASPLSAIPLSAINLNASPLSAIPLSAIPLSAIGPTSTPLSAIPLSAIGPASTPLSAIPLSAIQVQGAPLSAIPLSAIGVEGAPLSAIPVSIPLSAIPLSAIDAQGAPLSAIQVEGAPLSAIPLSAIALADSPLSAIPLSAIGPTDWCGLLADVGAGFDCTTGADPATTTLRELSVRGVPLSAIPLSAIPLSAIPLSAIPLSAIPLSVIPLSVIPLSAIPLSAIDLQGTPLSAIAPGASPLSAIPLSAIPLSAIDVQRSPLSAIPLSAIPLSAIPLSAIPLSAIPLSAIPLSAIPLSAIDVQGSPLSAIPLSAIDVQGSPLSAIPLSAIPLSAINCSIANCATQTLGEAAAAGAVVPSTELGDIQSGTSGVRLGELIPFLPDVVAADVVAALEALGLTMDDLTTLDDLQLGDLAGLSQLDDITLADIEVALYHVRIADLIGALIDPTSGRPFTATETEQALRDSVDDLGLTFGELLSLGDVTVGELVDGGLTVTLEDIEPILGFITIQAMLDYLGATGGATNLTLGDLDAEQLGRLTLADLFGRGITEFDSLELGDLLSQIQDELEAFSLGDLLLLLLDASSLNFGGADFEHIDIAELPSSTIAPVSFSASFTASSPAARSYPVELELSIPSSASYVPDSAVLTTTDGGLPPVVVPLEPTVTDNVLRWSFTAVGSDIDYEVAFQVKPQVTLGSTVLQGSARLVGTDVAVDASSSVAVAEGLEPNDFPPPEVTPLAPDTIYLTYIPDSTDVDVFEITLADRDVLSLELSNLSADFDLAVYVDGSTTGAVGTPLATPGPEDPIVPLTDPDQTGADAEVLDDFPRLDHIDPNLELIEVSNARGVENELIVTEQLPAGTYYVQVYGANGAVSAQPAALQARVDSAEVRPVCQAVGQLPAAQFGTTNGIGATTNTLFLVNEMRLEQLHSSAERLAVMAELDELVTYLQANPALGVDPAVVAVDGFPDIRDAYDAWDNPTNLDDACDPEVANAIVGAINTDVIDPIRDQIEFIVIIGGDDQIPMARLQDGTAVANEYDYRHEFDGDLAGANRNAANSFTSAFWESRFLSDEPYGESSAQSLGSRYLYVSDAALGRLVETPDEIIRSLADFRTHQGTLDISTGAVLGYDFLSDGSAAVAAELTSISNTVSTDLADGVDDADGLPWDRVDAEAEIVAAGQNALISLNAHFDHYRALPANGDQKQGFTDNLIASTVAGLLTPDGLEQSLVFSMGCHSGLAVPDGQISVDNTDWAQQISSVGGIYIANTGFGYGDTETVAYTEQLMALFAKNVTSPVLVDGVSTTVGEAFKVAKNRFIADLAVLSVYDEKASMESTFYGLPFYRTALPAAAAPPIPVNQPVINASGDSVVSYTITPANNRNQTDSGVYYSNPAPDGGESIIVAPGRPIQPSAGIDVSVVDPLATDDLAQVAHGALIVDMVSNYVLEPDPVIATPIFDESDQGPEPAVGEQTFPAVPVKLSTYESIVGTRQQLVVATGRYRSDAQSQRLDSDIDVLVNYAPVGETDFDEPTISNVTSTVANGLLSVSLTATDASSVDRVHVLVGENPGSATVDWRGFDLSPVGASRWSGSIALAASTTDVEFLAQAQDTIGNVGYATNKAKNFNQTTTPPTPPPPTPGLDVSVDDANLDAASGWYTGPVQVAVASGTATAQYSIDGGPLQPVVGPFEITGDGIHTWTVVTSRNQTTNGVVRIDSTGDPVIVPGTPVVNGSYLTGTASIDLVCTDPSLVACDLTINGVPAAIGDPLPTASGMYVLVATATDAFGNTTTTTLPFEITSPVSSVPVIVSIDAPGTPQLITDGVLIDIEFEDADGAADNYVVTIDWGDLVDEVPGTSTVCTATSGAPQNGNPNCEIVAEPGADAGLAVAFFEYAEPGVYPITVTVTDSVGNTDTSSYEFVVVYDPAAGRVAGSGWYWSGNEAYDDGDRWGNWAFFGYSARYKKNATTPTGTTKLRLLGEFYFKSTGYDYLLINDTVAVAEGVGKLDGQRGYRFRVQGVDNGWIDFFQITIWDEATGEIVYDNGVLYDSGDLVLLGGIRIRS